jgi:D-alanyl-D-alanine carboxypeptidase
MAKNQKLTALLALLILLVAVQTQSNEDTPKLGSLDSVYLLKKTGDPMFNNQTLATTTSFKNYLFAGNDFSSMI